MFFSSGVFSHQTRPGWKRPGLPCTATPHGKRRFATCAAAPRMPAIVTTHHQEDAIFLVYGIPYAPFSCHLGRVFRSKVECCGSVFYVFLVCAKKSQFCLRGISGIKILPLWLLPLSRGTSQQVYLVYNCPILDTQDRYNILFIISYHIIIIWSVSSEVIPGAKRLLSLSEMETWNHGGIMIAVNMTLLPASST